MNSLSKYILESQQCVRPEALEDWRSKYKGGKFWESYLKSSPKTITHICAALAGKEISNWNGKKGAISDFISMFFCGYLGKSQDPLVKVKDFVFDKEDGKRTCTCTAYDKWCGGEIAQFTFELTMNSESDMRAYRANKFDKMVGRKLKITCSTAKYKKDNSFFWKSISTPIIKMSVPPISDANRQQFHAEVIKQMLDAAHYMDWGIIDPKNTETED